MRGVIEAPRRSRTHRLATTGGSGSTCCGGHSCGPQSGALKDMVGRVKAATDTRVGGTKYDMSLFRSPQHDVVVRLVDVCGTANMQAI